MSSSTADVCLLWQPMGTVRGCVLFINILDSLTAPCLVYNTAMYTVYGRCGQYGQCMVHTLACAAGAWFMRTRRLCIRWVLDVKFHLVHFRKSHANPITKNKPKLDPNFYSPDVLSLSSADGNWKCLTQAENPDWPLCFWHWHTALAHRCMHNWMPFFLRDFFLSHVGGTSVLWSDSHWTVFLGVVSTRTGACVSQQQLHGDGHILSFSAVKFLKEEMSTLWRQFPQLIWCWH